ncbi:hypothetical protein LTR56_009202 [Elasticomyces elasticus]|nr:hypothetical protein LTR56_009202 [Elasticomyces elasticus]KAK3664735.1 hypothetical protein LTR22_004322 [Elasticomyces elasticus]KAK4928545.1 hypothetical protein LTR49_004665 [Elasticomyces elasticus]KAK5765113.1 hypothetical protein LTS12_004624 [Elasticomyces elasticus]
MGFAALYNKTRPSYSLPAELRLLIYELVSTEEGRIAVTKDLNEPALLSVSMQIRMEARKLWYLSNRWSVKIVDFDASVAFAWGHHTAHIGIYQHIDKATCWTAEESDNMSNLGAWLGWTN